MVQLLEGFLVAQPGDTVFARLKINLPAEGVVKAPGARRAGIIG
jgi:hypothetical protein